MKINEEEIIKSKELNVIFSKSGSGSDNTKISLPISWVRDTLGLSKENRKVEILLIEKNIVIRPKNNK